MKAEEEKPYKHVDGKQVGGGNQVTRQNSQEWQLLQRHLGED